MYDPTVGRWTTQDPEYFKAGDVNLYRYVNNEPTNARDPSGLLVYPVDVTLTGASTSTTGIMGQ